MAVPREGDRKELADPRPADYSEAQPFPRADGQSRRASRSGQATEGTGQVGGGGGGGCGDLLDRGGKSRLSYNGILRLPPGPKRFLEGCSAPFMRLAQHLTALCAWCKQCLPGR